jgi:hypothetical protein
VRDPRVRDARSRASVTNTFDVEIATVAGLIAKHRFPLDTAQVLLNRPLSPNDIRLLIRLNGGDPRTVILERRKIWWDRYQLLIRITRPHLRAVEFLHAAAPDHVMNRLDVALDLMTATPADAETLRRFLDRHVIQKWHGRRRCTVVEGTTVTTYYAAPWQGRNLVIYPKGSDRIRVEVRLFGMQALRRYGLQSGVAPLQLDFEALFQRNICLVALVWPKVQRAIDEGVRQTYLREVRSHPKPKPDRGEIREEYLTILSHSLASSDWTPTPDELHLLPVRDWYDGEFGRDLIRNATARRPFTDLIKG